MLNDAQIEQLRLESKVVSNGKSRVSDKRSHLERNYLAESASGSRYKIFVRQCNLIADNFSCGIMYQKGDGQWIILARYNGSDHPHANDIEKTSFEMKCHIHIATERYQVLSKKALKLLIDTILSTGPWHV